MKKFKTVADPYTGETWAAIPAIGPDVTLLHVHEADEAGNVRISGARYDDILKAKAASKVIVTCERVIPVSETAAHPERTDLPGFLVDAVIHAPGGAWPHSCDGEYGFDEGFFKAYLSAAGDDNAYQLFVTNVLNGKGGGQA